ncbi:PEP-CTERM sorting domain-containing protein [Thioalkalivibrio sp. XN8]|nr:PEP-CTERM sorting domain-containing protein [Thioalkalivibrio sp. XN8]
MSSIKRASGLYCCEFGTNVDRGGDVGSIIIRAKSASAPEPGTLALLDLGLAGMGQARRRKQPS